MIKQDAALEVRAFHEAGWDVLAIDYTPAAIERARIELGELADCVQLTDSLPVFAGKEHWQVWARC